jgi:membrane-bound lytic murein transglycosylase D
MFSKSLILALAITFLAAEAGAVKQNPRLRKAGVPRLKPRPMALRSVSHDKMKIASESAAPVIFDIPITYNKKVKHWIKYFQTTGRKWFRRWLERSYLYMPYIKSILKENGLPQDLAYLAMIESGFSLYAKSSASAVGPWQFIKPTAKRFGLKVNWWIDERKDIHKSTKAAAAYLKELYGHFGSWYLVAAGYNAGENKIKRLIKKHKTGNYWKISQRGGLVAETKNYVPKLIAATLIAKAPNLYGFSNLTQYSPLQFDLFRVPGGTRLNPLADYLGVTRKSLQDLNSELILKHVPKNIPGYFIKIPKGATYMTSQYFRKNQKVGSN